MQQVRIYIYIWEYCSWSEQLVSLYFYSLTLTLFGQGFPDFSSWGPMI